MNKFNAANLISPDLAFTLSQQDDALVEAANDVKALDDWQLALVGGGENIPCW
jgi:hypothetical protein